MMIRITAMVGLGLLLLGGCSDDDGVTSEATARQAYLGLEKMIDRAMDLGFDGYNAATSANIPPQTTNGDVGGTLTVSGKVDQGSSSNKEMQLELALVGYSDGMNLIYDTGSTRPALNMSLKKIPDGDLTGSLSGTFHVTGDLDGDVVLVLAIVAKLEPDPADNTKIRRKPGTIVVSGTATSVWGTYQVDLTL